MDYHSTLEYLYGLTDYSKERIARYDPETLNLSRMRRVLSRLGDPHERFPALHIAGTKGKGSVAVTCASVLQAAGLRTGLYTSPHLHTFRERIRVDGQLIPPDMLTVLLQECRSVFDAEPELTTFEAITALAFKYFAQCQVDFAVVEVGLGGRLDATNLITPQAAVITSLSFDHTYLLGNTLAEIAFEKAGIIKPGIPTVCAPQKPEALAVIQRVCAERGSPLTLIGREWTWQLVPPSSSALESRESRLGLDGQSFQLDSPQNDSPFEGTHTISLLGRHQLNNAAAAIAALDLLRRRGVRVGPQHLRQGLVSVRWPGRFEILRPEPALVVDCAHNGDSAVKLTMALQDWFPGRSWSVILGASSDKDVAGMLRALAPHTERLLATQSRHPRAMSSLQVAEIAREVLPQAGAPAAEITVTDNVGSALVLATEETPPHSASRAATCVTGSIFAVADAREFWALYTDDSLPETDYPLDRELLNLGRRATVQTLGVIR